MSSHNQLISVIFLSLLLIVSCSDSGDTTSNTLPSQSNQKATLTLDSFILKNYQSQSVSWSLSANRAELFQDTNKGFLRNILINFYNTDGTKTHTLSANTAETLDNQKSFLCQGDVAISSFSETTDITSDSLLFESALNQITTDSLINIEGNLFNISGNGLFFQTLTQDVDIHNNIDATIYVTLN